MRASKTQEQLYYCACALLYTPGILSGLNPERMANRGVALILLTHLVILGSLSRVITRRDLNIDAGSHPFLPFLEEEYCPLRYHEPWRDQPKGSWRS